MERRVAQQRLTISCPSANTPQRPLATLPPHSARAEGDCTSTAVAISLSREEARTARGSQQLCRLALRSAALALPHTVVLLGQLPYAHRHFSLLSV